MTHPTSRASLRLLSALALVLASAAAAWGQTSITGCPFTIGEGENGPGLYQVARNLTSTGTCITVKTNDVVIDLRGHTITGNGTGSGIVAQVLIPMGVVTRNIIVHNGRIRGFFTGVDLAGSELVTLDQLVVSQNASDGILVGPGATITNTTASGNQVYGIVTWGTATLDAVTVAQNVRGGILTNKCCTTATRVQARKNGGHGFELYAGNHLVTQSTADDNTGDGIYAEGGHNFVVGSVARRNGGFGIRLVGPSNGVVDSVAHCNVTDGIRLAGDDQTVVRSEVTRNGLDVADFGLSGIGAGLRVLRTVARKNAGAGIASSTTAAIVVRSTATKNQQGVRLNCTDISSSNALLVQASNNPGGNLVISPPVASTARSSRPARLRSARDPGGRPPSSGRPGSLPARDRLPSDRPATAPTPMRRSPALPAPAPSLPTASVAAAVARSPVAAPTARSPGRLDRPSRRVLPSTR